MDEHHCVNCGHDLTEIQYHTLEPQEMSVIQQWVAPQQISKDNLICHNCWLEVTASRVPQKGLPGPLLKNACIHCGRSVLRKRNHLLKTDTDRDNHIKNIIMKWIQPRKVSSSSRICHACWSKANRASVKISGEGERESAQTYHTIKSQSDKQVAAAATNESQIILPNYTRAANTENRCIFLNCRGPRIRVPTSIRVRLLCDLSFYVPENCRICNYHLKNNEWDSLIRENGNHNFTAAFIEDLISLLKNQIGNKINFENIAEIDDHLVNYWLGISKDEFQQLLDELPQLSNRHRGATGLAAYLIKLKTGDSIKRLSSLLKIPRSTLERLMSNAREVLTKDFIPQNVQGLED